MAGYVRTFLVWRVEARYMQQRGEHVESGVRGFRNEKVVLEAVFLLVVVVLVQSAPHAANPA